MKKCILLGKKNVINYCFYFIYYSRIPKLNLPQHNSGYICAPQRIYVILIYIF